MFSSEKRSTTQVGELLVGFCFLAMTSTSVSATEYRLFVDDAAACSSAGKTGSVCVVEVAATTVSTVISTTSPPTTVTTTTTADDCDVTGTWSSCDNGATTEELTTTEVDTTAGEDTTTGVVTTTEDDTTTGVVTTTEDDTTILSEAASAPSGDTVVTGDLDFGSGGGDSGVTTHRISVTNDIIAYPFTVKQGAFYGSVGIYPTSQPYPTNGSEIRLWWSKTKGGPPLAGVDCSPRIGRESNNTWDQSKTVGYGCQIDNVDSTLYLNLQACISTSDDTTCSAADAKAGSAVPTYIGARVDEVQ